jgi:hypothetical protein
MEYITITNQDLVNLYKGLEDVKSVKGTRFSILVAKNLKEISQQLKELDSLATPTQEFIEVSAKVHKLAEENNEEEIKRLELEHADLIEERRKQIEIVEARMQDEVNISIETIREDQLPEDLTSDQILPLLHIIR